MFFFPFRTLTLFQVDTVSIVINLCYTHKKNIGMFQSTSVLNTSCLDCLSAQSEFRQRCHLEHCICIYVSIAQECCLCLFFFSKSEAVLPKAPAATSPKLVMTSQRKLVFLLSVHLFAVINPFASVFRPQKSYAYQRINVCLVSRISVC